MHVLAVIIVLLISFTGTAWAAGGLTSDGNLLELGKPVFDAVMSGQYWYAAALALVVAFALIKRYLAPRVAFLRKDAGIGVVLAGTSFAGAMVTGLAAGAAPTLAMLKMALGIAVAAGGGYKLFLKPFVLPLLLKVKKVAPVWMGPAFSMVLWIFESAKKAGKAGDAAVAKDPPSGTTSVTGEPKDVA